MNLSLGIIGLPNVGKSTLFNALMKRQAALAANYPFATIEPNVGIVDVPDERLSKLSEIIKTEYQHKFKDRVVPEKIIPAVIKFYDIAGLVKGASQGEGLGNQFLSHIRDVDVLIQVVRAFEDENVVRAGSSTPKEDIEIINTELILADLQVIDKRVEKARADAKKFATPENIHKVAVYEKLDGELKKGTLASHILFTEQELEVVKDLQLLTLKPMIYVLNVSEGKLNTNVNHGLSISYNEAISLCASVESELCSFTEEDKKAYMKELQLTESGLDKVIKLGSGLLGLQTFLTAGPKEVRAWTVKKGALAPEAAGVIHSDFQRGFISAEVVAYSDLVAVGGWKNAKDKGLIRIEGKTYVMKDGDVVEFRFNV